jgi:alpha-tubulin suppressor-like RCC1 family protein
MERKQRLARSWASKAWRWSAAAAALVVVAALVAAGLAIVRGAHATSSTDPYTWGSNNFGQLGVSDFNTPSGPALNHISIGVTTKSVVSGSDADHVLAVGTDGSLWGWGSNTSNAITTDSNTAEYAAPVQIPGVSGVSTAAAGSFYTLALTSSGVVWAWGADQYGQLGIGTTTAASATPTQVVFPSGTTITAISAGDFHSLAVDSNGNVWAWGYNGDGELGTGTTGDSSAPVQVTTGTQFTAVAAGESFSLGLTSTGAVYAWGSNGAGQLGNGTLGGTLLTPAPIPGLSGVSGIAAGQAFGIAVASSGVYAWGDNTDGQIGNGSTAGGSVPTPSHVAGLSGVTATAVAAGDNHALALTSNGSVYAWGYDNDGQVGSNGGMSSCGPLGYPCSPSAVQVTGLPSETWISAGTQFSLAAAPTSPAPAASVSPASVSFGNEVDGTTSAAQSVTLTSTGTATLTVTSVTIGGANPGDFAVTTNTCSGQVLAVGSTCSVAVTFTPAASGPRSATLTFSDNAATGSPQTVSLSGNGTYSWTGPQTTLGLGVTIPLAGAPVLLQFKMTGADAGNTGVVAHVYYAHSGSTNYQPTNPAPNTFSYSGLTHTYSYTWNTLGLSPGTYSVQVDLGDGAPGYITVNLAL